MCYQNDREDPPSYSEHGMGRLSLTYRCHSAPVRSQSCRGTRGTPLRARVYEPCPPHRSLHTAPQKGNERESVGPGVQILAADHPRDPGLRASGLEFGRPVRIGRNVWIGAGAIILPGISIDDDALIGAGSVVTRDVPAGATAFGNPARLQARTPRADFDH